MFQDPNIWLHYDDSTSVWGWVMPATYPRDVVIGRVAVAYGRWSIAGTIVHELAHLNGADGHSHAAEETLKHCGLQSPGGPYDPHIKG